MRPYSHWVEQWHHVTGNAQLLPQEDQEEVAQQGACNGRWLAEVLPTNPLLSFRASRHVSSGRGSTHADRDVHASGIPGRRGTPLEACITQLSHRCSRIEPMVGFIGKAHD